MHAIRFWHHSPLMGGTAVETVTLLCTQGRASSERLMWNASATTICILSYRVTGCLLHRPAATQHAHRTRTGARIERRTVIRPNPVSVEPRKTLGLGSPKPRGACTPAFVKALPCCRLVPDWEHLDGTPALAARHESVQTTQ